MNDVTEIPPVTTSPVREFSVRKLRGTITRRYREQIEILDGQELTYDMILGGMQDLGLHIIQTHIDTDGLNIHWTGAKGDLLSFCKLMFRLGLRPQSTPRPNQPSWSSHWKRKNGDIIPLYTAFASTDCKMVQTGTKMVEQAVYGVSCTADIPQGLIDSVTAPFEAAERLASPDLDDSIPF